LVLRITGEVTTVVVVIAVVVGGVDPLTVAVESSLAGTGAVGITVLGH